MTKPTSFNVAATKDQKKNYDFLLWVHFGDQKTLTPKSSRDFCLVSVGRNKFEAYNVLKIINTAKGPEKIFGNQNRYSYRTVIYLYEFINIEMTYT